MPATLKLALSSILTASTLVLVGSCGYGSSNASQSVSGPVLVTQVGGHKFYRVCDNGYLVYLSDSGGVSSSGRGCG